MPQPLAPATARTPLAALAAALLATLPARSARPAVPDDLPDGLVGLWTFDEAQELTAASDGRALELVGEHAAVEGPDAGDGAVRIGVGSFYRCHHDIAANGGGDGVNRFTLLMDVRVPELGPWYALHQTNWENANDGDWFIRPTGQVGVGDTGYSGQPVEPDRWVRLAISADLGDHYDYYLDGHLLHTGGPQERDGRFAMYAADAANQVLLFADDNGEDAPLDVALVALFDRDLEAAELAELGGYGGNTAMPAYLQSPTPTSIYVGWHSASSSESVVELGLDEALGRSVAGGHRDFGLGVLWHSVLLDGLRPDTTYHYRCSSGDAFSPIRRFHTPAPPDDRDVHVRFGVYGDNRTDTLGHRAVVQAMRDKAEERFGPDLHRELDVVLNVGDIVTDGRVLPQYQWEWFGPASVLSGHVPFMVSIGNHEREADLYYDYMEYEELGGAEGELYYSFSLGTVLFVALNSNTRGDTQLAWLEETLVAAQAQDDIDWVFAFLHHPGRSEVWPDGNTPWVQDEVIPMLARYGKAEGLFYGHSHNYERGAWPEGNVRLLLAGGGGSSLDRWGMYDNQEDYPEIQRAHDHYGYTLFDVDCATGRYVAESYSLGHPDLPWDNELLDTFYRDRRAAPPGRPRALSPAEEAWAPLTLQASAHGGEHALATSRFQLTAAAEDWDAPLLDVARDLENVYGDTGPPDYEPIDLNAGIDLTRLAVAEGTLELGDDYRWRVRYRDDNLLWSDWSEPSAFTFVATPVCGDGEEQSGEACDDGNRTRGDGCSADCLSDETCGNGVLDPGELCDDANLDDGDGCSAGCIDEALLECPAADAGCSEPDVGMDTPDVRCEAPDVGCEAPDIACDAPDVGCETPECAPEAPCAECDGAEGCACGLAAGGPLGERFGLLGALLRRRATPAGACPSRGPRLPSLHEPSPDPADRSSRRLLQLWR